MINRRWGFAEILIKESGAPVDCQSGPLIHVEHLDGGTPMSQAVSQISEGLKRPHAAVAHQVADPLERMLRSCVQTARPGQVLVMEGAETNSVLCVLGGWLSQSKCLPEGEIQIVDFALPGDIVESGATGGSVSAVTIEALTDVKVAVVPAPTWEAMKRSRPDLGRVVSSIRAASRARLAERMLRLGRGRAVMRMAYALLELQVRLEAIGQSTAGRFHLPMNQRVLGDFIGLSSVHVCRTLGQLTGSGIIEMEGHMTIHIRQIEVLAEMAGVDPQTLQFEILGDTNFIPSALASPAYA